MSGDEPLSLCIVDIDDFKRINDAQRPPVRRRRPRPGGRFPPGRRRRVSPRRRRVRPCSSPPPRTPRSALAIARSGRRGGSARGHTHTASGSAPRRGSRPSPIHGFGAQASSSGSPTRRSTGRSSTARTASVPYRADVVQLTELRRLASGARTARPASAQRRSLAHAVDARDAYVGRHSSMVGGARRPGCHPARAARRTRSSSSGSRGSLHDLGKLAIPEEILRKPGAARRGRAARARAPSADRLPGCSTRSEVDPVASWVLHHHERWDGDGLPVGPARPTRSRRARASSSSRTPTTR